MKRQQQRMRVWNNDTRCEDLVFIAYVGGSHPYMTLENEGAESPFFNNDNDIVIGMAFWEYMEPIPGEEP